MDDLTFQIMLDIGNSKNDVNLEYPRQLCVVIFVKGLQTICTYRICHIILTTHNNES